MLHPIIKIGVGITIIFALISGNNSATQQKEVSIVIPTKTWIEILLVNIEHCISPSVEKKLFKSISHYSVK